MFGGNEQTEDFVTSYQQITEKLKKKTIFKKT